MNKILPCGGFFFLLFFVVTTFLLRYNTFNLIHCFKRNP